jgi:hypothetical protein
MIDTLSKVLEVGLLVVLTLITTVMVIVYYVFTAWWWFFIIGDGRWWLCVKAEGWIVGLSYFALLVAASAAMTYLTHRYMAMPVVRYVNRRCDDLGIEE